MKVRSFIAIELGEREKRSIELIQNKLKRELPAVRWVKPHTIHLTLKFLGYIEESLLPRIKEMIDTAARDYRSFPMRLSGIGAFPNARNPRVIWIGVREESGTLKKLTEELDGLLSRLGIEPEDRAFSPHLTLGRVKERGGGDIISNVLTLFKAEEVEEVRVDKISLMRSDLKPQGPIYTTLHQAGLQ